MNLMLRSSSLGLMLSLALAAGAQAADHLTQVSEVHPSATDAGMAFVELHNPGAESFPSLSYTLASVDASGAILGRQVFNPPYGLAGNTQPFLIGGASRQPRDAALTIPLAGARKVCFYRGTETSDPIDCLSFGEVPEGQSAQRTSSGTVVFACPTPDTANRQTAEPCPGAAPTPASAPAPVPTETNVATADIRAPGLSISARRVQQLGRLRLGVVVDERATVTVSGSVRVAARSFALATVKRATPAGTRTTLTLKLTRKGTAAVRGALRRGARVTVTARVAARDLAGNVSVKKLRITVKS